MNAETDGSPQQPNDTSIMGTTGAAVRSPLSHRPRS